MKTAKQLRAVFACSECGYESPGWHGRCPECAAWNTFAQAGASSRPHLSAVAPRTEACELASLAADTSERTPLGMPEFDRVLGGGLVAGSVVLLGGDPGIGKSTLLLQAAQRIASPAKPLLYVAGEESPAQIKMRAQRLRIDGEGLFVLGETDLAAALQAAGGLSPAAVIVDSIQTVASPELEQAPGSIAQLRQCAMDITAWAKRTGVPVLIAGHVTKDGDIAGPRLLEHIVDVVLYLEGDRFSNYRLLRGVKNRFGSVDETGVFEMSASGLCDVADPSGAFIAERAEGGVGSVVTPALEGTRPLLVEVQALVSPSVTPAPRRTANGLDFNRLLLVSAVLSRRTGVQLASQDLIASVAGGLRVHEPAADAAVAVAIASSLKDAPVVPATAVIGEVGLSGELRSVSQLERRLAEAARHGFRRCILPASNLRRGSPACEGIDLVPAPGVREAVSAALT